MLPMKNGTNRTTNRTAGLAGGRSPFATLYDMHREMDRMFDQMLGVWSDPRAALRADGTQGSVNAAWIPSMDLEETASEVRLHLDVPGLSMEDLNVEVTGDVLTISGERRDESRETDGVYRLVERRAGRFERRLNLPEVVDADRISASYENGVLHVTMPKRPEVFRSRRIEIGSSSQQSLLNRGGNGSTERERGGSESANGSGSANGFRARDRAAAGGATAEAATAGVSA